MNLSKRVSFDGVYLWRRVKRVVVYLSVCRGSVITIVPIVIVIVVPVVAVIPVVIIVIPTVAVIVVIVPIVVVIVIIPPPVLCDPSVYVKFASTISGYVVWFSTVETFSLSLEILSSPLVIRSVVICWWVLVRTIQRWYGIGGDLIGCQLLFWYYVWIGLW